jgi:lipopolysaccharide transport protein LptA
MARHEILVEGPRAIEAAADTLALAILRDLGGEPAKATPRAESPPASSAPGVATGDASASSGRGLDTTFDFGGFSGDAPIEIKAEEAEIVNRNDGRDLIFQRNVFVRQANITLRSDRLEASYDKGESDPRKLVAIGSVHVDQGDRQARCDRAVFLRDTQQLTCIGHAELVQGCDVVRGDSIRFDLARDRARVEGAASIVIRPDDTPADQCLDGGGLL